MVAPFVHSARGSGFGNLGDRAFWLLVVVRRAERREWLAEGEIQYFEIVTFVVLSKRHAQTKTDFLVAALYVVQLEISAKSSIEV